MAELTTLARPYAKAAFEHAQAHQQLANWSAMLGLAAAVSQDDTMQRVLPWMRDALEVCQKYLVRHSPRNAAPHRAGARRRASS